ncbi:hypothetical protein N8I77_002474 [Diaporthe amygdali]|uniref:Transglycosylase SLT domain-containing protein n=1 Tax=Phomopsis amygdali TaxID=1214568 RepID=A0AAD9SU79_PHOAM|nr:hypothetical protein N8I77_002474 [Diaporthe amygdali]
MVSITPLIVAVLACNLSSAFAAPSALAQANGRQSALPFTSDARPASNFYSGPWSSFPAMNTWVGFDSMFNSNKPSMLAAGSTQQDVDRIYTAITGVASSSGIDPRVLLGIMMEESHGGVGVVTTWNADGQATGGLMQASGCHGFDGQNNLAQADITYMVDCGTQHYKRNLVDWGGQNAPQSIYPALREYNSGSVIPSDLSLAPNGAGNFAYVSQVAQRFVGWVN